MKKNILFAYCLIVCAVCAIWFLCVVPVMVRPVLIVAGSQLRLSTFEKEEFADNDVFLQTLIRKRCFHDDAACKKSLSEKPEEEIEKLRQKEYDSKLEAMKETAINTVSREGTLMFFLTVFFIAHAWVARREYKYKE